MSTLITVNKQYTMKQFFKFIFASCLGTFLALILISLVGVSSIAGLVSKEDKVAVKPNSVLKLSFTKAIPEKTDNISSNSSFSLENKKTLGLTDILKTLEAAKTDDNIKGIYIASGRPAAGMATMSRLRDGIEDFKESGKFVISYSNNYSQGNYYLSSAADKVYLNPMGGLQFAGFATQIPFFKDLLDRLGIKPQVFYAGKFKSATEPFRRDEMSPENRKQTRAYLDEYYQNFLTDIGDSRNISVPALRDIANELKIREPEDALRLKMVDGLMYKDQVLDELRDRLGIDKDDKINSISLDEYSKSAISKTDFSIKGKIAVVYAEGNIVDGEGEPGNIGGERYARIIRKIREDDKVKAIVLRVNSGGGSSLASEIMWREIMLAKEQGIKFVVSMGDFAASGGYYIACEGEKIFAEPNTITGSIGVFGVLPNIDEFLDDELGISFDTVKTAKYATTGSPMFELNEAEKRIFQVGVDSVYIKFKRRVAEGRNIPIDQVEEFAQGRVWTGTQAKKIGLIDELGGLDDALAYAAELAEMDSYRTTEYPKSKDKFEQIIEQITGKKPLDVMMKSELGDYYKFYEQAKQIKEMTGIQARIPYQIEIQ